MANDLALSLSLITGIAPEDAQTIIQEKGLRGLVAEGITKQLTPAKKRNLEGLIQLLSAYSVENRPDYPRIAEPADVVKYFGSRLRDIQYEEFHILALDTRSRVREDILITKGLLDSSLVHPREVFRAAIVAGAAAIILVHNHPSGDPTPSAEDRAVTRQLVAAGQLLDMPVYDHVIISGDKFISFATASLL